MFIWDDKFSIGINEIDNQHKEIFKICRNLELLLQVPKGIDIKEDAIKVLCSLREYVTFHFYTEENFMKSIHYARFLEHKNEHDNFKKQVVKVDINNLINSKNDLEILLNNLYSFLLNHVLKSDMLINK